MENRENTNGKMEFFVEKRVYIKDVSGEIETTEKFEVSWGTDTEPLDRADLVRLRDLINAALESEVDALARAREKSEGIGTTQADRRIK